MSQMKFSCPMSKKIGEIAEKVLHLETLETRNSDSLDFHEHAVWKIQQALELAYIAGQDSERDK